METVDWKNQLALVTGGTGGIGVATCRRLADLGCSIAIHYNSDMKRGEELAREIQSRGPRAEAFQADLGNYDDVRRLFHDVVAKMGSPSILFANAGTIAGSFGVSSIADVSLERFESTWRINCGGLPLAESNSTSVFLLTQLCIPAMEQRGWGRVIFNSSVAAFTGGGVGPHYSSSKSALHGLIHWLSQNYCRRGITVNGIAPALITGTKIIPGSPEELASKVPVGRLGSCEEVAETVAWMVKTAYVTNKVVGVDGGIVPQ